jgi:SAM-dependent methyltransferase
MQAAELEWWANYLGHPTASYRMYALYGARYLPAFNHLLVSADIGDVIEYGCGPLPAILLCPRAKSFHAVDTLWSEYKAITPFKALDVMSDADEAETAGYDTALLFNVLDHTDEPERLITQAYRALREGGRALVFVHLGQEDPKHRLVTRSEVMHWFRNWSEEWSQIQQMQFDPPAFVGVFRK